MVQEVVAVEPARLGMMRHRRIMEAPVEME